MSFDIVHLMICRSLVSFLRPLGFSLHFWVSLFGAVQPLLKVRRERAVVIRVLLVFQSREIGNAWVRDPEEVWEWTNQICEVRRPKIPDPHFVIRNNSLSALDAALGPFLNAGIFNPFCGFIAKLRAKSSRWIVLVLLN